MKRPAWMSRHRVRVRSTELLTELAPRIPLEPRRRRVVVLCYHSVHPTKHLTTARPELFDDHLAWLREHTDVVALADIPTMARTGMPEDRPAVAITFDDGFDDNHRHALPLLVKHGLTATFFTTTGLVGEDPDVLARFGGLLNAGRREYDPMAWSQVRELAAAGMDIGDHTYRHPTLSQLAPGAAREELRRSKDILEEQLGQRVRTMAYPFGKPRRHVQPFVTQIVRELGYEAATSILHRAVRPDDDPLTIPRFTVLRDPIDRLAAKVNGPVWDVVGWGQEHLPLWVAKQVMPEDFGLGT